ncbi:hypothetical protein ACWGPW_26230, partial [Paenibacillus chitinolyticus]
PSSSAAKAKQADADGVSTPACSLGFFHLSVKRGLDQKGSRLFAIRDFLFSCPDNENFQTIILVKGTS